MAEVAAASPFRRHASEQYFTCSQVRAQRLRQVMGRPQATQGLEGSDCLLPLKEGSAAGADARFMGLL